MNALLKMVLFSFVSLTIFNTTAQAGVLLEPYVGYVSGQAKQSSTSKYTGTQYGARLGYSMSSSLTVGLEYAASNLTDDSTPQATLAIGDLGVFVAYKFPMIIRLYGTYVPSAEVKSTSSGVTSTFKSGNAMKLGVGYTGFPIINVNLEYYTATYSKLTSGGVDFSLSPSLASTGYALVISAPFMF